LKPLRLTAVLVHPVQYYAPWFRHLAAHVPEIDLTVLYATEATPEQQGVGFGRAFTWDVPLTEGYRNRILAPPRQEHDLSSDSFFGVDARGIGKEIAATEPDAVLVPGWYSVSLLRALVSCRAEGWPAIYRGDSTLDHMPAGLRALAWRAKTRAMLSFYSAWLATGTRSREYLAAFGRPAARVFPSPHAVDNEFFAAHAAPHQTPEERAAAREAWGLLGGEDFVVLFAGKLTAIKRPLDLVRAMAALGPGAALLIAGDGPLAPAVRAEAERLSVRVAWAGFLNQSEIARAYAAADCLALPSESETWGLAVNEAMATGLPAVVSHHVGCAPDLIVPRVTGEVFPAGDAAALAAALDRIRQAQAGGHDFGPACRARAGVHSFAAASAGLVEAVRAVAGERAQRGRA
jgi:glycosyltransferase involved in cell wall biosynthesis